MMLIYPDTYLNDYKPKPSPWDIAQELEQELTDEERDAVGEKPRKGTREAGAVTRRDCPAPPQKISGRTGNTGKSG